ncbi:MFS transporter [Roseibium aggregatum]|uniref:MFS transporter n=1 Tax=Roseibium aggregatum TaxID=187304 RepID=A0A926S781_9HYPH|nr:MFS transporter [Roseibium aggregatum]MBD1548361.1 MFS transporter [Roseibium aggregatum]
MQAVKARRAVATIFFLLGTLIGIWASRIPDIKAVLGLDEAGFGLVLLTMAFGAFVAFPIIGRQIDRVGAARITRWLAVLTLILFVGLAAGTSVPVMVPLVFAVGFCIGALDIAMNAWGAEVEQALHKPVMSSYHGLYSLGAGVGAAVGAGAIRLGLSVPQHFVLWGLLMAIMLAFVLHIPWTSEPQAPEKRKGPLLAIPKGALFFVGIMALIAALGEGAVTDWAAVYQIEELGFGSSQAAIGFALFSGAMVVMRLAGDQLIARFGPVPVARLSGLAAAIGAVMLVIGTDIWLIWAGCVIMGLGNAVIFPLAMSRAAADPVMSKGAALAAVATLGYGAFLFGPPVLGFIGTAVSLRAAFGLVAVLALLIFLLAGALKVEGRR